jgi:hypothetical protein
MKPSVDEKTNTQRGQADLVQTRRRGVRASISLRLQRLGFL